MDIGTQWDAEADVLIVGYGGAGAAAAITAHDAGAEVIVLEKSQQGGGNTRCAGGSVREYLDVDKAAAYFQTISLGSMNRDVCQAFVAESIKNLEWIREIGGEFNPWKKGGFPPAPHIVWPHIAGAEGIGTRWYVKGSATLAGTNLWNLLSKNVVQRKIKVIPNTPAKRLLTNSANEVIGVIADSPKGEKRFKARRAVILTCGGFESNTEMHLNYLGLKLAILGTPANTGDGIKMAQELGADLWHMNSVSCSLGYKVPEYDIPFHHRMRSAGYIYVDQNGYRFIDEAGTDLHAMAFSFFHLNHHSLTYPRIPSYVIFDESTRLSGKIIHEAGWINDDYQWSEDNGAEIKKGWIKTSETIRDLAPQIGLNSETLQQTLGKYNLNCVGGYDPEFGRRQETLGSISQSPFYAISIVPSLLNTQGGPKRNSKAQVVDVNGHSIKRLYSAGELGSIWGIVYPGAGNISECLAFGRIAGRNAAAEQSWGE